MKKVIILTIFVLFVFGLAGCGKKNSKEDYENCEHVVSVPLNDPSQGIKIEPVGDDYTITKEDIMGAYHKEEVHEVQVTISVCKVYDKPYGGKAIGYLVNEDFKTEELYRADLASMYGFAYGETSGHLYETAGDGLYAVKDGDFSSDTLLWVSDDSVAVSLVFHPEDYDSFIEIGGE